jgi:hypothetical protein
MPSIQSRIPRPMSVFLVYFVKTAQRAPHSGGTLLAFAAFIYSRFDSSNVRRFLRRVRFSQSSPFSCAVCCAICACLTSCAHAPRAPPPPSVAPADARAMIEHSVPRTAADRAGWVADMYGAFAVLGIEPTHENICAVTAVIEQESGFRVDPVVPGLPAIAWREIDNRAERAGVPRLVVHTALQLKSPTGRTYSERIDSARTERDLSRIFEDFIGAIPLGRTLFSERNPVRTRGPMQVNIAFAEQYAASKPYPYPVKTTIADEVFTRRGSVYFGTAHLLAYAAPYSGYLYRFADFNAGQYASRNAAFQSALGRASGIPVIADGALLPHDAGTKGPGSTELAVRALRPRLNLADSTIHDALAKGRAADFDQTELYQRVFALAEQAEKRHLPRALIPRIELHGPKITRKLTTEWYARRVDQRFKRCLEQ